MLTISETWYMIQIMVGEIHFCYPEYGGFMNSPNRVDCLRMLGARHLPIRNRFHCLICALKHIAIKPPMRGGKHPDRHQGATSLF